MEDHITIYKSDFLEVVIENFLPKQEALALWVQLKKRLKELDEEVPPR